MISPIRKLKIGIGATLFLLGLSFFLSYFFQLVEFKDIDYDYVFLSIGVVMLVAYALLAAIFCRLWKYHELCKECFVQKEMVKDENIRKLK